MITASRDVFYNVLMGEWKGLDINVMQISYDGDTYCKKFKLDEFVFDEVEACENCYAPQSYCNQCDGVVEILALLGHVQIKKRLVEDGCLIPLLGDVLFDLREGHLVILTDTDVVIINRAEDNQAVNGREAFVNGPKGLKQNSKVKLRMYLTTQNKVKRIALNALHDDRKFEELAGQKAVAVELTYVEFNKKPVYLRSLKLFNVYFDLDGKVNEELTFPKPNNSPKQNAQQQGSKVVQLNRRDKAPELTRDQKESLKKRLIKDFGEEVWENSPVTVKLILE